MKPMITVTVEPHKPPASRGASFYKGKTMKIDRKKVKIVAKERRTWQRRWRVRLRDGSMLAYYYTSKGGYDLCLGASEGLALHLVYAFADRECSGRTSERIRPAPRGQTCFRTRHGRMVLALVRRAPKFLAGFVAQPGQVFLETPDPHDNNWNHSPRRLSILLTTLCQLHDIDRVWTQYDASCLIASMVHKDIVRTVIYNKKKETIEMQFASILGEAYYHYTGTTRPATDDELSQFLSPDTDAVGIRYVPKT
jgi:hypothetical protein